MNIENQTQKLEQGLQLHQAGELQKAQAIYTDILNNNPGQADALHLSALIAFQTSQYDLAEVLIEEAIKQNPNIPEYLNNGGEIYRVQGKSEMALVYYQKAIELNADYAEAHNNLALTYKQLGQDNEALQHLQMALNISPDYADACNNLGIILFEEQKLEEAAAQFCKTIQLNPQHADSYNNLGLVLKEQGLLAEAMQVFDKALSLNPNAANIYNNMGITLQALGRYEEAVVHLKLALTLAPAYSEAFNNLGFIQYELGQLDEAEHCFQQSLKFNPNHAEAHVNLAHLHLLKGQFETGWKEYQWRFQLRENKNSLYAFDQVLWQGEELHGRSLLVHAEQGIGDTIQFIRYLSLLKGQGCKLYFHCDHSLHHLFKHFTAYAELVDLRKEKVELDFHVPLLSLPKIFETDLASIPEEDAYISFDRGLSKHWHGRLTNEKELNIGLCWQGNPKHKRDACRSISLGELKELFGEEGLNFISLQKGTGSEQFEEYKDYTHILNPSLDENGPFTDTAAIIQNLDLVITIDSAVAHLSAAMGKPTWILLSYTPDWRWLLQRSDSPWYPEVRLFRQNAPGDWSSMIQQVAKALREFKR